eukprot:m.919202 g.919202  ORF g.919202 m.919202 type:complete len:1288 (+) comp60186_c0_seq3:415-4278(+)
MQVEGSITLNLIPGGMCHLTAVDNGGLTDRRWYKVEPIASSERQLRTFSDGDRIFNNFSDCWSFCQESASERGSTLLCDGILVAPKLPGADSLTVLVDGSLQQKPQLPPIWALGVLPGLDKSVAALYGFTNTGSGFDEFVRGIREAFVADRRFNTLLDDWGAQHAADLEMIKTDERELKDALRDCLKNRTVAPFTAWAAKFCPQKAEKLAGSLSLALSSESKLLEAVLAGKSLGHPAFTDQNVSSVRWVCETLGIDKLQGGEAFSEAERDSLHVLHVRSKQRASLWVDPLKFFLQKDRNHDRPLVHMFSLPARPSSAGAELSFADWYQRFLLAPISEAAKRYVNQVLYNSKKIISIRHADLSLSDRIALHSLAQSLRAIEAVEKDQCDRIELAARIPPNLRGLLARTGFWYGGQVLDFTCQAKRELDSNADLPVQVCDFSKIHESLRTLDSHVFTRILESVRNAPCLVVVIGLPVASNHVMKWCCELTAVRPWVYLYFVENSIHHLFPEIKERLKLQTTADLSTSSSFSQETLQFPAPQWAALDKILQQKPEESKYNPDWVDKVLEAIPAHCLAMKTTGKREPRVWLVSGPPGIGKSFMLSRLKAALLEAGIEFEIQDGSSGELVRSTIDDLIREKGIKERSQRDGMLWCIDEWHFLKDYQKDQVLAVSKEVGCSLLLIANRYDQTDLDRFSRVPSLRFVEDEHVLNCRGSHPLVLGKFISRLDPSCNQPQARRFLALWHRVMRSLLGEEVLSFRYADKLALLYDEYCHSGRQRFTELLQEKFYFLDSRFCLNLQEAFFELMTQDAENKKRLKADDSAIQSDGSCTLLDNAIQAVCKQPRTLVDLLVFAAAADTEMRAASYAEFCRTPGLLDDPSQVHPGAKLYRFVLYLLRMSGKSELVTQDDLAMYRSKLGMYPILEVPGQFPCIQMSAEPLLEDDRWKEAQTLCTNTNPHNLDELQKDVNRGFVLRSDVAKVEYEKKPITDVAKFEALVTAYPQIVSLVSTANLDSLVRHGKALLAEIVIHALARQRQPGEKAQFSLLLAAWRLYTTTRGQAGAETKLESTLAGANVTLLETFAWAAEFGHLMPGVEGALELQAKVVEDLIRVTSKALSEHNCHGLIRKSWSGLFAPLLGPSLKRLPAGLWFVFAEGRAPAAQWPEELHVFVAIFAGSCTPARANMLPLLVEDEFLLSEALSSDATLASKFVKNLVKCCGTDGLSEQWQTLLLPIGNCFAALEETDAQLFQHALRAMFSGHSAQLRLADSAFKRGLQALERKLASHLRGTPLIV